MISKFTLIVSLPLILQFSRCNAPVSESAPIKVAEAKKVSCYFFFIPDCPACLSCFSKVKELQDNYKTPGFSITAVYADPIPDTVALNQTLKKYAFSLPILYDTNLVLAKKYKISTTPQFILLDEQGNTVYSGPFDNYYYSLGKHRSKASENYLEDALTALLNGKQPVTAFIEPVGCKLNYSLKTSAP